MAAEELILKLNDLVNKTEFPSTECEVVYFMVEVRKILDRLEHEKKFGTLYFYCNWVVHNSLDRGNILFNYFTKLTEKFDQAQPFIRDADLYGLISFDALREQVMIFMQDNHLNDWSNDKVKWKSFKILLFNILLDSPLEDNSGKFPIAKFEYKLGEEGNIDYIVYDRANRKFSGTLLDGLRGTVSDDLLI